MSSPQHLTFVVPGEPQSAVSPAFPEGAVASLPGARVKSAVRVTNRRAGGGVRLTAVPGEDVVVLHIAGGPALVLHPENARDLLLAQSGPGLARSAAAAQGEVDVPARLQWRALEGIAPDGGTTRGFLGDVLLSAIEVITGHAIEAAATHAASHLASRVDAQVDPGLYALGPDALPPLKSSGRRLEQVPSSDEGPLLVLVHGTFSNTSGTFSKLWSEHPGHVRALFRQYGGRVYALDHATLGASPVANAVALATALPAGARVHLLTHSRGGLVAEALARAGAPDEGASTGGALGDEVRQLTALVRGKALRVERVARIACPARGTLLASKRLDAYLSVFKWTLDLSGVPVLPHLVEFIAAVARERQDPDAIPGLAAQVPDSALIRWLHAGTAPVPGDLRVLAGDVQGDSVTSWLKTLLADAFYWTDNDLVVQTRSMYGGAARRAGASFVLDRGGSVSHFAYFSNSRTADAIVAGLTQDGPQGFRAIGPLSWAGESSIGARAGRVPASAAMERPAVILLPTLFGSALTVGGDRVWPGWQLVDALDRLASAGGEADLAADSPVAALYGDLAAFLSETHDVIQFGYDWRAPLEAEAARLADAIDRALVAREASGQPVRILAHGMGGLLARTVLLDHPGVWERMVARPGARVVMLGVPNGGSWEPMQILSGDDTVGGTLVAFGGSSDGERIRQVLASLPGPLQLQAGLLDQALMLGLRSTWEALAADDRRRARDGALWHNLPMQLRTASWGIPPQAVLDRAIALRRRLDAQRDAFQAHSDTVLLVLGHASSTPDGYVLGERGLEYVYVVDAGDGRVTHRSALLPGLRAWGLEADHGALPRTAGAFPAYLDLLQAGTTILLPRIPDAAASESSPVAVPTRGRPSRSPSSVTPPQSEADLLSVDRLRGPEAVPPPARALRVSVVNGDLTFVREPLLLGHYMSMRLTGTEAVMNRLVGGAMEASLAMGLYPNEPGSHHIFLNTTVAEDNPWRAPRPEAVIVVGLGREGTLRAGDLARAVRQAVIAWSQRVAEDRPDGPPLIDLAATLIGSGGTGISVGQAAQLAAQGVREANTQLEKANERLEPGGGAGRWPRVGHLRLVELYLDRATEAWRALQMQAAGSPGQYIVADTVADGAGALPRPLDSGYRGADYDFIRAVTQGGTGEESVVSYTLDTRRARSEVRAQTAQTRLLRDLVARAASDTLHDPRIGRTLFNLLIPVEIEPYLSGSTEMQIELDRGTAAIPWEVLDTGARGEADGWPWAIRTKLLRKLRTESYRAQVSDATPEASVLVIGEPECDPERYPRLPGAREEARAVASRLTGPSGLAPHQVKALISPDDPGRFGPDARTIINTLFERDWRIVHIAGHGEPPQGRAGGSDATDGDAPAWNPRGVVLSNDTFLGPNEIRTMRTVPELVFVNCCYLGARQSAELLAPGSTECAPESDLPAFASGVADELIRLGVRCVVAAGWAVEDEPARAFATTFYRAVVRGERFIDAVAEARKAAWDYGGNTWAAYQCYGDPDWRLHRTSADAQRPAAPPATELASVGSRRELLLALETIAVRRRYQQAPRESVRESLRYLETHFAPRFGTHGDVAEGFAAAWAAAGDRDAAVAWYERALAANDGTASLKAAEQAANLRVRLAWEAVEGAARRLADARATAPDDDVTAVERELARRTEAARRAIGSAVTALNSLVAVQPSMERESLLGSAYKRLGMVEALAGASEKEAEAITRMREHYERAEELGRTAGLSEYYYPAMNRLSAELALRAGEDGWPGLDPGQTDEVRQQLERRVREEPDFWSIAGLVELRMYEAVSRNALGEALPGILDAYEDLHARLAAAWMWSSIHDQAHFVLSKYMNRSSAAERAAAADLMGRLRSWRAA